uniref:Uncharacterized protein n=1 Tax=Heterorhabditis bacteriophora TaxID=37862 RepID=A0A1I7WB86_HETBA
MYCSGEMVLTRKFNYLSKSGYYLSRFDVCKLAVCKIFKYNVHLFLSIALFNCVTYTR